MFNRLTSLLGYGQSKLTREGLDQILQEAISTLQAGDSLRAEELVDAAVKRAAEEQGPASHLHAQALFNKASVLCGVGDLERAAAMCRLAAEVPAVDRAGQKDRLTYWMNLGEILTLMERHEEAEVVLRQGLAERETFYGTDHPGYAFGLAPLADNLLAQSRAEEAQPIIDQAISINWEAGHEAVASDLSIRAFIVKTAQGPAAAALDMWQHLPPNLQAALVSNCIERAERAEPQAAQAVLLELRLVLQGTPDVEVIPLANVNAQLANMARLTGDHDARIEACQMSIKLCGGLGDAGALVNAWEGLAMAFDDAGRDAQCEDAYRSALDKAAQSGHPRLSSNVLRNLAIWQDSKGRQDEAQATHDRAVAAGEASGDHTMHGRALAASGIFHQHGGRREIALSQLRQSLQLLPPSHADAFCAQSHLIALEQGLACMCSSDTGEAAVSQLVEQMVRAKTGDLLKAIRAEVGEDGPDIKVELTRPPTEQELAHVQRVVSHVLAEMRNNYRRRGFAADS